MRLDKMFYKWLVSFVDTGNWYQSPMVNYSTGQSEDRTANEYIKLTFSNILSYVK